MCVCVCVCVCVCLYASSSCRLTRSVRWQRMSVPLQRLVRRERRYACAFSTVASCLGSHGKRVRKSASASLRLSVSSGVALSIVGGLERLPAFGLIRLAAWALAWARGVPQHTAVAARGQVYVPFDKGARAKSASKWGSGAGSCVVVA